MKIKVKVTIGKQGMIKGWDGATLHVVVNAAPIDGASNRRLQEILSDWSKVSKSNIAIVSGLTNRYKLFSINAEQEYVEGLISALPRIAKQESLF